MLLLIVLLSVVAVQQVLDVWSTTKALSTGQATEANGPLRKLMDRIGVMPALLATKAILAAVLFFTVQATLVWYIVLSLIIVIYTGVLWNNHRVLRALGVL